MLPRLEALRPRAPVRVAKSRCLLLYPVELAHLHLDLRLNPGPNAIFVPHSALCPCSSS